MRYLVTLAVLLLAATASADSAWYEVTQATGAAGSNAKTAAEGGRLYTTTVDAGAQSVVIGASACSAWVVTAILAATTFDVVGCTDATCDDPTVLPTGALSTGDYAHSGGDTLANYPYLRIDNATANDVARLYCAK